MLSILFTGLRRIFRIILTEIKSKKEQDKKNLILLEGNRLIKDAIISGCVLKYILFSRKADLMYIQPFLPKIGINLYKMPYRELQMWSDLSTSPGIMGIIVFRVKLLSIYFFSYL